MQDQDKEGTPSEIYWDPNTMHCMETNVMADLDTAISMYEEAMQCTEPVHPQLATHAHSLAMALTKIFELGGALVNIEAAISNCQTAIALTEDRDAESHIGLTALQLLFYRFERLGSLEDLEDAISNYRMVVELTPGWPS